MKQQSRAVVILAAGQGSRMKSDLPKVLHPVLGYPMIGHVLRSAASLQPQKIIVITGHGREAVEAWVADWASHQPQLDVSCVQQVDPRGTGHALQFAVPHIGDAEELLVLYGDVPLLRDSTLSALLEARGEGCVSVLAGHAADPTGYGRVLTDDSGRVAGIVEHKDASEAQRQVQLVNAGMMALRRDFAATALDQLDDNNAQGELYLTDLLGIAAAQGTPGAVCVAEDWDELQGVNTRAQCAAATDTLRRRVIDRWMVEGVSFDRPDDAWVEVSVRLDRDVTIGAGVELRGCTDVHSGAVIRRGCVLLDVRVEAGAVVKPYTVAEDAVIGAAANVGPFTHLRPGTRLDERTKVGNFVETKKAHLRAGAKASHLSYLGDCDIGAASNIGAGTITCNYDGKNKFRTVLGEGVFIGSDTQLVAPVNLGDGAYVGAGTTVTEDVPAGALAISRSPQRNIEGWVERKKAKSKG